MNHRKIKLVLKYKAEYLGTLLCGFKLWWLLLLLKMLASGERERRQL